MKKPIKPTRQETKAAIETQAPVESARPLAQSGQTLAKPTVFKQLAKTSRRMQGDATQFAKPEMLFNDNYRDGLESTPFFIMKAFEFDSKNGFGHRLGLSITVINGNNYNVAVPLTAGDAKRNQLLKAFEQDSSPIGPVCFQKLPMNKGNDYYDIIPYGQKATTEIDIPFPDDSVDDTLPF